MEGSLLNKKSVRERRKFFVYNGLFNKIPYEKVTVTVTISFSPELNFQWKSEYD
jgi:hypothetical protein